MTGYDVIIIGAGIQGCATAFNLALRKCSVLLLEKKTAGRQASGVNAGGVRRRGDAKAELQGPGRLDSSYLRVTGKIVPVDAEGWHADWSCGCLRVINTKT